MKIKKQFLIVGLSIIVFILNTKCNNQPKNKEVVVVNNNIDTTKAIKTETSVSISPIAYGIDISNYQGEEIDFLNKQTDSLSFIICKATEGITYTDPEFKNNWKMISQKGFIRGTYHFYHCQDDPNKQANQYLTTVDSFGVNDFPPIIDFEEASLAKEYSSSSIQKTFLVFLKIIQQKTGRIPIIYSDYNTSNIYLTNTEFENYPLWIASYVKASVPKLPNTWENKGWTIWQRNASYNIKNDINDFDVFNGTVQQLKTFISSTNISSIKMN